MKGYKKVIAVLMAAAMMFCGTAVFAADAAPEAGETLIMGDNFDDVRQTGNYEWNGLTLQEGENGNIGLVEAGTEARLGYGSLSISNFILKEIAFPMRSLSSAFLKTQKSQNLMQSFSMISS